MRGKLTTREKVMLGLGAVVLIVALGLSGGLLYALNTAGVTTLRWWAGLATALLPFAGALAYWLGRLEARGHVAGLAQGIEAVSKAAQKTTEVAQRTADIRVTTAQRMRHRKPGVQPAIQQAFLLPGMSPFGGGGGVILPPQQQEEDVEL